MNLRRKRNKAKRSGRLNKKEEKAAWYFPRYSRPFVGVNLAVTSPVREPKERSLSTVSHRELGGEWANSSDVQFRGRRGQGGGELDRVQREPP